MRKLRQVLMVAGVMALAVMPVLLLTGAVSTGPVTSGGGSPFVGDGSGVTNSSHTIIAGSQNTMALGNTLQGRWVRFGSSLSAVQTTANTFHWPTPYAMTLTNFWVGYDSSIAAGTNVTFIVFTNGVGTPLTASFTGTGAAAVVVSNLTVSVFIPQGVNLELCVSNNAATGPASQTFAWTVEGIR